MSKLLITTFFLTLIISSSATRVFHNTNDTLDDIDMDDIPMESSEDIIHNTELPLIANIQCSFLPFNEIIGCACWLQGIGELPKPYPLIFEELCFCQENERLPCFNGLKHAISTCFAIAASSAEAKQLLIKIGQKCGDP